MFLGPVFGDRFDKTKQPLFWSRDNSPITKVNQKAGMQGAAAPWITIQAKYIKEGVGGTPLLGIIYVELE